MKFWDLGRVEAATPFKLRFFVSEAATTGFKREPFDNSTLQRHSAAALATHRITLTAAPSSIAFKQDPAEKPACPLQNADLQFLLYLTSEPS